MLSKIRKIFGTANDKKVKAYLKRVKVINSLEDKYEKLSDHELQNTFNELKKQVQNREKSLDSVLNDSFAITREVGKRTLNLPFASLVAFIIFLVL